MPRRNTITKTGRWKALFLASLAQNGNVTIAAEAAGVARQTPYNIGAKDKQFDAAMKEAIEKAADRLEAALYDRGRDGVTRYVHYKGVLVTVPVDVDGNPVAGGDADPAFVKFVPLVEKEYDTPAAIAWLKANRANKFRENINLTNAASPVVDEDVVLTHTAPPPTG